MRSHIRPRLRTKTGCLTCRSRPRSTPTLTAEAHDSPETGRRRRKKCDEKSPVCRACESASRKCEWPTTADLLDRRFASHWQSRHQNLEATPMLRRIGTEIDVRFSRDEGVPCHMTQGAHSELVLLSYQPTLTHAVSTRDVEICLLRHFVNKYYSLIILPRQHHSFYDEWLTQILDLMASCGSLYDSILACAASHIHFINACSRMQELSLSYYARTISKLTRLLSDTSQIENHDGLFTTVIFLYIHGCMGRGTIADIPRHLNAATSIVKSQLLSRPISAIRSLDILSVESVLYHIFHVRTGLWSDSTEPDYYFDTDFWARAENLLDQSKFLPGKGSSKSPVLGVPVSLLRLALLLRQRRRNPLLFSKGDHELHNEVFVWEESLLRNQAFISSSRCSTWRPNVQEKYYQDASYLYIIVISLLLRKEVFRKEPGPPSEAPIDNWQLRMAIQIIKTHDQDDGWARCFIGNWPTYTLGFFMSAPEDKEVIRADMHRRWDLTKLAQISRFSRDLEGTWESRSRCIL